MEKGVFSFPCEKKDFWSEIIGFGSEMVLEAHMLLEINIVKLSSDFHIHIMVYGPNMK